MDYKISKELAQEIINYLARQPYNQVANLIDNLKQIKPLEEVVKSE